MYSLLALHLEGFALDHPVMRAGFEGLDRFTIEDELGRRVECCQSPVWDTALAMIGLSDAGVAADHPALAEAADWVLGEEIRVRGDWAVRRPDLEPSGWAFEFENDNYADTDDTAIVGLALRRVAPPRRRQAIDAACRRALRWLEGMQCADGGWGAFDVDNTRQLCRRLPFCDFGEVIDPPSADVTAHVLEFLAAEPGRDLGAAARRPEVVARPPGARRIVVRAMGRQPRLRHGRRPDGTRSPPAVRATTGRSGEPRSGWRRTRTATAAGARICARTATTHWVGRGESTPSQTAWALLGLLAAKRQRRDRPRACAG